MLRVLRRRFDLSQRQLATASGVPKSTVADIESGRSVPSVATWSALAAAVGWRVELVDVDDQVVTWLAGPSDPLLDRRGRRYPAHLDVRLAGSARERGRWEWVAPQLGVRAPETGCTFHLDRDCRDVWRWFGHYGLRGPGWPAPVTADPDTAFDVLSEQQLDLLLAIYRPP